MRLYLAAVGNNVNYLDGLGDLAFLVSYFYINKSDRKAYKYAKKNGIPLFLDSGAFSAMNSGAEINLDTYTLYCQIYGHEFEVVASLDVIGDWRSTRKNHEHMKREGLNSIITFHIDSPYDEFIRMLGEENYIALGVKGQQGQRGKMHQWLDRCFELREKYNPNCKIHGFGLTTPSVMKKYPFYSIDGTTWITAASKFGRIMILDGDSFKWLAISKQKQLEKYWDLIKDEFEGVGWDLHNGRLPGYEKISLRYNAKNLIELAKRLA